MSQGMVRTGALGAIAPVDFGKEAQTAPYVYQHPIIILAAPVD